MTISGGTELKIRWWRVIKLTSISAVILLTFAFLFLWAKFRGTPVKESTVSPDNIVSTATAPLVIRIWPGRAPGSESWTQYETEVNVAGEKFVRNVVDPTITAYFPPADKATGAAMIVAPGGAFHMLAMNREGTAVARYLNSLGVTAFVLKYRLTETSAAFPIVVAYRLKSQGGMDLVMKQMTPLVLADAQQSMRVVRSRSAQWGLDPERIGMIGFSAGGFLALNIAIHNDADTKPNLIAAMYPLAPTPLTPPSTSVPLFATCAKDDPLLSPASNCVRAYDTWHAADIPAELHVFETGGHGFGMRKQNKPTDEWPELFHQWLQARGFLTAHSIR
jgi:acetyl esterase/lipase